MPEHTPAPTPTRAVYGFYLFLLFKTLFIIYVIWAFVPRSILEDQLGLTYLPDKYFALFVPILLLVGVTLFAFFIYPSLNMALTSNINDISTIKDQFSLKKCQYRDKSGKLLCNRKTDHSKDNVWEMNKYCDYHNHLIISHVNNSENELTIEDYCDCQDDENCLLKINPEHLETLRQRKTVPPVSDLDISDVCKILYGIK